MDVLIGKNCKTMNKMIKHIFVGVLIMLTWAACQHEEIPLTTRTFIGNIMIEPSYTSAVITCDVASSMTIEKCMAHVSKSPDFSNCQHYFLEQLIESTYTDTISGLEDDMTYYVRYRIYNSWSAIEFDTVSVFKTLKAPIPIVSPLNVD